MAQHSTEPRSNAHSHQTISTPTPPQGQHSGTSWAIGGTVFAGVLMMVGGVLGILNGIAAIATDDVYTNIGDYVFEFSLTTWGWIHLVLGAVVAFAGWGILQGRDWARGVGIALASLYAIAYFMFLPYAPVWSVIVIAASVFVMWSLATAPDQERRA
ncbi:DUF7144 family membrane protein [Streptomyces neyagawaensis]|uniref:DUF7144 family membrane protein n=1 Tax=Streptomyces neyagawaensis TaxID=42238 RepID=UPI0006E40D1C|nr:hypothetical protein [Streptomyces neyagawaensis]MCL6734680.1 hypothetical protein [Streptomyces neyagawaensis]MDE1682156.1 hypothetical protein [Streptomyces neyagawaensis]